MLLLCKEKELVETIYSFLLCMTSCGDSLFTSFSDGEKLTSGKLEEFIRQVVASGTLQEVSSEVASQQPKEMLRMALSLSATAIEEFLSCLSEGTYDSPRPKIKVRKIKSHSADYLCSYQVESPVTVRARTVKAELNDVEGLGFKLEERQQEIIQLKKSLKMKVRKKMMLIDNLSTPCRYNRLKN